VAQQQDLTAAAAAQGAMNARGQHPRAIGYQQIAWLEQGWQVAYMRMRESVAGAIEDEQAGRIARFDRLLRDQLLGQRVLEIGGAHGS
jgi:hypothetical protein